MIIDCHGHYTTAPKSLEDWRNRQVAALGHPADMPRVSDLVISDDELRESVETNQLKKMRERGSDLTIFSPRASFMAHHIGDFAVSSTWASICNELIYRVTMTSRCATRAASSARTQSTITCATNRKPTSPRRARRSIRPASTMT